MKEQKLRQIIREELNEMAGGPWENVMEMVYMANERGLVQDIGQKRSGGEPVHEFEVGGRIFQIKELK
jgi:hypothetical protein